MRDVLGPGSLGVGGHGHRGCRRLNGIGRIDRANTEVGLEFDEGFFANALHIHQLFGAAKATVFLAKLDDALELPSKGAKFDNYFI